MHRVVLSFFSLLILLPCVVIAQDSDTEPPQLVELDFNPKSVDVTAGPQTVTATARITDDLSGVGFLSSVLFYSDDGVQFQVGRFVEDSGDALDGVYTATVEIPEFARSGTWTANVQLSDGVFNQLALDGDNLAALGFPVELQVTSVEDVTAPMISDVTLTPPVVDVSDGDQVVTLELRMTDDLSGAVPLNGNGSSLPGFESFARLVGPVNDISLGFLSLLGEPTLVSGSPLDGMYRVEVTIRQHSAPGNWSLTVSTLDAVRNSTTYENAATVTVLSSTPDTTPPALTGLSFTPAVIDTSAGEATVTATLDFTAGLAGGLTIPLYNSPSGSQSRSGGPYSFISGDLLGGTVQFETRFPQFSEDGTWKVSVHADDWVGNHVDLEPEDLQALGLPTDLIVVRPSLDVDATVGTGGGTIADDTFGDRAQVTFPPGLVAADTDVAIDVFPDPLAVETPAGFQGPGTYFVNINLDPEPAMPFAAPGLTAVLPLTEFINPGTPIPLYYVDELTGLLEPMTSVATGGPGGGGPVIGFVNADGLSATFDGISHLTILVGLVPDAKTIDIDVKPFGPRNLINTASRGLVPVGIVSSEDFYAPWAVDRRTLTFGRTGDEDSLHHCEWRGRDVNRDRVPDLVCWFRIQSAGFADGDEHGVLKGETFAREAIIGIDEVTLFRFSRPRAPNGHPKPH